MKVGDGSSSPLQIILGVVFLLLGLGAIGGGSFAGLAALVVGGILLWHGYEWGKLRRVKKAYEAERKQGKGLKLNRLAERLDMEPSEVRDALQELSRRGLVPKMSFVAGGAAATKSQKPGSASAVSSHQDKEDLGWFEEVRAEQPKRTTVRCRSCGAAASLFPGEVIECEHCGNTLTL